MAQYRADPAAPGLLQPGEGLFELALFLETDRFDAVVEEAGVIDLEGPTTVDELFDRVSRQLGPELGRERARVGRREAGGRLPRDGRELG